MRQYETLFVMHPELGEVRFGETIERAKRLIEGMGGRVARVQEWGMRELAFPIQKQGRGYYVVIEYASDGDTVRELERMFRIADEVLRFVSVRATEVKRKERPSRKRKRQLAQPPAGPGEPVSVQE